MSLVGSLESIGGAGEDIPIIGEALGVAGRSIGKGAHRWANLGGHGSFFDSPPRQGDLGREYEAVERAAAKWHISPIYVWYVYGKETSHGTNVKPSSTGAQGPFQFEPETAKRFGYPLNANTHGVTNLAAFSRQADATAHYLSTLLPGGKGEASPQMRKLAGTSGHNEAWDKALRSYSGGGYGLDPKALQAEGRDARAITAGEAANATEYTHLEEEAGESIWQKLLRIGVKMVLLLIGAVLVVYGIMVAVKPPGKALSPGLVGA